MIRGGITKEHFRRIRNKSFGLNKEKDVKIVENDWITLPLNLDINGLGQLEAKPRLRTRLFSAINVTRTWEGNRGLSFNECKGMPEKRLNQERK